MAKTLAAGLLNNIVSSYDKTKTTVFGRAALRTIGGSSCIGAPLTKWIDVQTDMGIAVNYQFLSPNGRLFVITAITSGVATVGVYSVDMTGTVDPLPIGKIQLNFPNTAATTHTIRMFKVYDGPNAGTTTGWQIIIGTTGSVLINGGVFIANNIALSDFSLVSVPTIGLAIASNAKAVYFAQDSAALGVNNNQTQLLGGILDNPNRRLYVHNGVTATNQFWYLDLTASPTMAIQTTTAATTSGSPTFTLTGHGYNANDQVVIIANAPTGFTASTTTAQTVYFVRNPTANTFELSATSGGASINATSVTSATQVTRAFGETSAYWAGVKTGNIAGLAGTLLANNSESYVTPLQSLDSNIPAALTGQACGFFASTTNLYLFKLSDIQSGVTTLPSLDAKNVNGTGTDFTAITNSNALYSNTAGAAIFISNTSQFYVKRWINNQILQAFGGLNTTYYEVVRPVPQNFAFAAITGMDIESGWLTISGSTTGQRGILMMDFRSDTTFGYSHITTQVLDTSRVRKAQFIQTIEKYFDLTASLVFKYKTAATSSDAIFNDPTSGWTVISTAADLSLVAFNNFTQFDISFEIAMGSVNTPAQVQELYLSYFDKFEITDYFSASGEWSTQSGVSPQKVAFRQQKVYSTLPTKFQLIGYDDNGNAAVTLDTVLNPSAVRWSSNSGTSWTGWTNMAAYPNAQAALLEFTISSPPSVPNNVVTWSLVEA